MTVCKSRTKQKKKKENDWTGVFMLVTWLIKKEITRHDFEQQWSKIKEEININNDSSRLMFNLFVWLVKLHHTIVWSALESCYKPLNIIVVSLIADANHGATWNDHRSNRSLYCPVKNPVQTLSRRSFFSLFRMLFNYHQHTNLFPILDISQPINNFSAGRTALFACWWKRI